MVAVQRTFDAWKAAQSKVNRSSKPASLAAARRAANLAERAYREASDRRDERDDTEMYKQALHIAKGGWGEASVLARAYLLRVPNPATGKIEED